MQSQSVQQMALTLSGLEQCLELSEHDQEESADLVLTKRRLPCLAGWHPRKTASALVSPYTQYIIYQSLKWRKTNERNFLKTNERQQMEGHFHPLSMSPCSHLKDSCLIHTDGESNLCLIFAANYLLHLRSRVGKMLSCWVQK